MTEAQYLESGSRTLYRLSQIYHRLANNVRMYFLVVGTGASIVHLNDHRAFWNTALGAKLAGARIVFNVRDTMREGARTVPLWRACLALCDRFLVLSQEMIEHYRMMLRPTSDTPRNAAKFAYLYSIVDKAIYFPIGEEDREKLRSELGVASGKPALVYVGRFDTKKAQLVFIRSALPVLRQQRPDALVYMVGDFDPEHDDYAATCVQESIALGVADNIRFVGYSRRIADWYRVADVVILASQREGLPRCVIEGLACGAPVVSFDVCSVREILGGHDCGVVVPGRDYVAMSMRIVELLSDRARMASYRQRGPIVAGQLFDPKKSAVGYTEIVKGLLKQLPLPQARHR